MSRNLSDLAPQFRERFTNWLSATSRAGLDLLITRTLSTNAEQDALFAQGRTAPGHIVTHARAGQSPHNYGLALDFVPMINGKPDWHDTHPAWKQAGDLAPQFGLEWGGLWEKFTDRPHIQVPNWRSLIG